MWFLFHVWKKVISWFVGKGRIVCALDHTILNALSLVANQLQSISVHHSNVCASK